MRVRLPELVELMILKYLDLRRFQQAANISIKINTTTEFMTDTINDLDHDMDKADVCSGDLHASLQIADVPYFQASSSNAPVFEEKNRVRSFPDA